MEKYSYKINDAAQVFGISRSGIYNLIRAGKIKPVKVAGRTLILASEMRRLFEEAA